MYCACFQNYESCFDYTNETYTNNEWGDILTLKYQILNGSQMVGLTPQKYYNGIFIFSAVVVDPNCRQVSHSAVQIIHLNIN